MEMKQVILGLSLTPKVGWKTIDRILAHSKKRQLFGLSPLQWKQDFAFLSEQQATLLSQWMVKEFLLRYEQELMDQHISYVTIIEQEYPPLLKEISFPPWILFAKGNRGLLQLPALAVVGSRKTSSYGRAVTQKLVPLITAQGYVIISGMALGTDAQAHQSALDHDGQTIAILGSGVQVPYPPRNEKLYQQIAEKGLLLSEYPPQTPPHPAFFPQRNRIIAGLSYGVVVIEAAQKSGSLITAHYALEQGREVFAVPGSMFDRQSVGTNLLIQQQGAKLITRAEDIFEELEHLPLPAGDKQSKGGLNIEIKVENKEREIIELLKNEKLHVNELRQRSSLSFAELTKTLLRLELKKKIFSLPGSYYQGSNLPEEK